MLLALAALSGLAAAFAAPIVLTKDDDEDDDMLVAEDMTDDSQANMIDTAYSDTALVEEPLVADPDIAEDGPPLGSLVQDSLPEGEVFDLKAEEGVFEFEDFDPRVDVARIQMPDQDATITSGLSADGTPEVTATLQDGEEMVLSFPGLTDVPELGIEFTVPDAEGGEDTVLSLADVLALGQEDAGQASSPPSIMEDLGDLADTPLDDAIDDLEDLLPIAPGSGDLIDEGTDALDDLLPVAPGDGDGVDVPPTPLPDVTPIAPNPGDEIDVDPVAPGSGDDEDDLIPVPLPGVSPVAPNPA